MSVRDHGPTTAACLRFLARPSAAAGTLLLIGSTVAGLVLSPGEGARSSSVAALAAVPDTLLPALAAAVLSGLVGSVWALVALVAGGVEAARRLTASPLQLAAASVAALGGSEIALIAAIGLAGSPAVAAAVHEAARSLSRGDLAAGGRAEGESEFKIAFGRSPPNLLAATLVAAWSVLPSGILAMMLAGAWATGTGGAAGGWGAMIIGADATRPGMFSAALVAGVTLAATIGVARGLAAAAETPR